MLRAYDNSAENFNVEELVERTARSLATMACEWKDQTLQKIHLW